MTVTSTPLVVDQAVSPGARTWLDGHQQGQLFIGGAWVPARSGRTFPSVNPTTGQVLAHVAEGDQADVDDTVRDAREAFGTGEWPRISPHARARICAGSAGSSRTTRTC